MVMKYSARIAAIDPVNVAAYAANVRTYAVTLAATYGTLDRAPGAAWYVKHAETLANAANAANVPYAIACGIIGVSSINNDPIPGERWAIATMNGATGGHLRIACDRAATMLTMPRDVTFATIQDIACDPDGDARKVRAFACNHATYGTDCACSTGACVAIDRWAARAASNGAMQKVPKGTAYAEYAAAYRIVAAEFGVPVSMLQAVVWVVVRGAE